MTRQCGSFSRFGLNPTAKRVKHTVAEFAWRLGVYAFMTLFRNLVIEPEARFRRSQQQFVSGKLDHSRWEIDKIGKDAC